MKNGLWLFTVLLFCLAPHTAATVSYTYGSSAAEGGSILRPVSDGGFIAAGYTASFGAGENDIWVLKFDSEGRLIWQKSYGGAGNDYPTDVREVPAGGFIICGCTRSFGSGRDDAWILRLNDSGGILWQKAFGGTGRDYATSVQTDADNGFVVTGGTSSWGQGDMDIWVMKLSAGGDLQWSKTYGGAGFDWASSLAPAASGGWLVAGDTFSFGQGKNDLWILRLTPGGDVLWLKTIGGGDHDWAFRAKTVNGTDHVLIADTFSFGAGENDAWLLHIDAGGNVLWQKTCGGPSFDWLGGLDLLQGGGFVAVGGTYSFGAGQDDLWAMRMTSSGEPVWQKVYGGMKGDSGTSLADFGSDRCLVQGTTSSHAAGEEDVWLLQLGTRLGSADSLSGRPAAFETAATQAAATDSSGEVKAIGLLGVDTQIQAHKTSALVNIYYNGRLVDALVAMQYVSGMDTGNTTFPAIDVNQDGRTGLAEAVYVLQCLGGLR